ncbi:lanthionine synthetase C family protein [Corallococcus carmarthensis]|uniref:lanthionine synthetase C family protein n=1 Tax=Corallococcus carmarthensis TaxID=2316728 RepID=UPI00148B5979|nr:lanthionine synthetase C family protein [Corallococcus carmarthensis]NOK17420.1 lanthionine synthetase C family protein [Corallococcus carmarthensis]
MGSLEPVTPLVPEAGVLRETVLKLARHMVASMDVHRTDRLFPCDPRTFQTNPLNVAHGACGTALFLHDALGEVPAAVREWLLAQPVNTDTYPPGLYSGMAGVAWTFLELGLPAQGLALMEQVPESPLAFAAADLFDGAAGWGLAALAFHLRTQESKPLAWACLAAEHLLKSAEHSTAGGLYWREGSEPAIKLGFGHGASGVGFFLLSLWRVTNEARYLEAARRALDFDLSHAKERDGAWVWGTATDDGGHRPYWLKGGGGIASTLIRFFEALQEERYLHAAHRAAKACNVFFSAAPHLFEGLASMGETLLDLYRVTGEPRYLEQARRKATQTLLFRVERPEGLVFPGRHLLRLSHDYGMGGAGIGLFLHRLMGQGPRRFHDLFPSR